MSHTDYSHHITGPRGAQRYRDPLTIRHVKVHQSLNALHQGAKPVPLPVQPGAASRSVNALDSVSVPSSSASHRTTGADGERRQSKVRIKLSKSQSGELVGTKTLDASVDSSSNASKSSDPQLAHVRPVRPPSVLKESNHFRMRPSLTKSLDALTASNKRAAAHSASQPPRASTSTLSDNAAHNAASRPAFAPVAPQTQAPPARRRRASLPNPERPSFIAGHGHAMPTIHDGVVVSGGRRSRASTAAKTNSHPFANIDQETQRAISASSQNHGHPFQAKDAHAEGESDQRWPVDIPPRMVASAAAQLVEEQLRVAMSDHLQKQQTQQDHTQSSQSRRGSRRPSFSQHSHEEIGIGQAPVTADRSITPLAKSIKLSTRSAAITTSPAVGSNRTAFSVASKGLVQVPQISGLLIDQPGVVVHDALNSGLSEGVRAIAGPGHRPGSGKAVPGSALNHTHVLPSPTMDKAAHIPREGSPFAELPTHQQASDIATDQSFVDAGLIWTSEAHWNRDGDIGAGRDGSMGTTELSAETDSSSAAVSASETSETPSNFHPETATSASSAAPSSPNAYLPVPKVFTRKATDPDLLDEDGPLEDPADMYDPVTYPPSMHQLFLFNHYVSSGAVQALHSSNPIATQMSSYRINDPNINIPLLARAIGRVARAHRVLHSELGRNPKIVDADVEAKAFVPRPLASTSGAALDLEQNDPQIRTLPSGLDSEDAMVLVQEAASKLHMSTNGGISALWQVLIHQDKMDPSSTRVYVLMSPLVGDERSADLMVALAWKTYTRSLTFGFSATSPATIPGPSILNMSEQKRWACEQQFPRVCPRAMGDFIDFAEDESGALAPTRLEAAMVACKAQVFESKQDYVDLARKAHLEREMDRIAIDRKSKEGQIQALISRIAALEMDLTQTEAARERMARAADKTSGQLVMVLRYEATGEVIDITEEIHEAILRTVLGSDMEAGLLGMLHRHGVMEPATSKFAHMTLEEFSMLTETDVHQVYGVVGREKRKVVALADMVRNRIRDAANEHAKLKFDLERKILRLRREVTSHRAQLKAKMSDVDRLAHVHLQYRNLVRPPLVYSITPSACLDARLGDGRTPYPSMADLVAIPLPLSLPMCLRRSTVLQLSRYAREYCRSKTDEDDDDKLSHVLLAIFAILVKHVSGMDSFVVGYRVSLRHSRVVASRGIAIGPGLTVTLPIRIDLRDPSVPLHIFVQRISREARAAEEKAILVGSDAQLYAAIDADIAQKHAAHELDGDWMPGQSYKPMVIFEYIPYAQAVFLKQNGLSAQALLQSESVQELLPGREPGDIAKNSLVASNGLCKEWHSTTDHSHPDLHLTAVELSADGDALAGRLAYRPDVAPRVAERWMDKMYSLLDGVDVTQRQATIAGLISRFYHSVWASGIASGSNVLPPPEGAPPASDMMGSVAELRQSVAHFL